MGIFLIFISYRRDDTADEAQKIEEHLKKLQRKVFRDVSDIKVAENFPNRIEAALKEALFAIVVIGKKWLNICDEMDRCRFENPNDFVRREIKLALRLVETDRFKHLIPVLVQGARMPKAEELPNDLRALANLNAHRIANETFEEDVIELSKRIDAIMMNDGSKSKNILDEVDEMADFAGGLSNIISLKPSVAKNPMIRDLPDLATWRCSIISREFTAGRLELQFETRASLAFDGEFLSGLRGKIEGRWRIGIGRGECLVLILKGSTHEGSPIELGIPIEQKVGERVYTGKDDSGRFYRLEWLHRGEQPDRL